MKNYPWIEDIEKLGFELASFDSTREEETYFFLLRVEGMKILGLRFYKDFNETEWHYYFECELKPVREDKWCDLDYKQATNLIEGLTLYRNWYKTMDNALNKITDKYNM